MEDLDSLLGFLDITPNEPSHPDEVVPHLPDQEVHVPIVQEEAAEEPENTPETAEPASLSDDDIAEILTDYGYDPYNENSEEEEEETEASEPDAANWEGFHPSTTPETDNDPETEKDEEEEDGSIEEEHLMSNEETTEPEAANPNAIPLNSPTLLIDDTTSRFSGAEWYNEIQKSKIILAGLGGIGSWCAIQLARMSPESLFLYDDDIVETVNMAGQLYGRSDVGRPKVDVIESTIDKYTSMERVYAIRRKFMENTEAGNIMICGFDNMKARRTFFNAWQNHVFNLPKEEWHKCLFLDGRLSMTILQVLCVTGDNAYAMTEYKDRFLFSDDEAEHTVCSMKQTTYLACMIGSIITNLFTNFIANQLDPIIPYDLPFFTEYDAQNMIFKTEH